MMNNYRTEHSSQIYFILKSRTTLAESEVRSTSTLKVRKKVKETRQEVL